MLSRTSRYDNRSWLVIVLIVAAFSTIDYLLPRLPLSSSLKTYILPSLVWVAVGVVIVSLGSYRPAAKLGLRSTIIKMSVAAGLFQIALYIIGGLFSGFGISSNSFAAVSIASNFVLVAGTLAGIELARAWLMNHMGRRVLVSIVIVTLLFTLVAIPPGRFLTLRADVSSVDFVNSTLLPTLASGLLASFVALLAGPWASLAYMGLVQAFWWFLPILPDLSWAFKGLIGTATPLLAFTVLRAYYVSKTERRRSTIRSEDSAVGWVGIAVFAVAMIWFAVGIFPIRPSLIASGSMSPALEVGDIAIVVKTNTDGIKVGDIIDYKMTKRVDVVHRVVAVQEQSDNTVFITKGDANSAVDIDPVLADNVIGKVVFTARGVGWPAIIVKGFFSPR